MATYLMLRITVSDGIKPEVPVEPYHPSRQTIEHLRQWWMDVKVIFSPDVEPRKGPEVDFIEHYLVWMLYSPEADGEGQGGEEGGGDGGDEAVSADETHINSGYWEVPLSVSNVIPRLYCSVPKSRGPTGEKRTLSSSEYVRLGGGKGAAPSCTRRFRANDIAPGVWRRMVQGRDGR